MKSCESTIKVKNQRGQALIETLYTFPIAIAMVTLILWTAASCWSLFWVEYQLQDAVICLSDNSVQSCRLKHERLIQQGAVYLRISNMSLQKRTHQLYGKINFSIPFSKNLQFKVEKIIPWPIANSN